MANLIPYQQHGLARYQHDRIDHIADAIREAQAGISRIYVEGAYLSVSTLQVANGFIEAAALNGMSPEQVDGLRAVLQDYIAAMQGIARSGATDIYGYITNLPPLPEPNLLDRIQRLLEG